jgi:hypothetical protein
MYQRVALLFVFSDFAANACAVSVIEMAAIVLFSGARK